MAFGVTKTFMCTSTDPATCDTTAISTTWTPDIPDDRNNAAQEAGSIVIEVPAGGRTLIERSLVRGNGTSDYQAGANVIITKLG